VLQLAQRGATWGREDVAGDGARTHDIQLGKTSELPNRSYRDPLRKRRNSMTGDV